MTVVDPDFALPWGSRGSGLPSNEHILNAIRQDLANVVLPEVQGGRAQTLLAMMDVLLRHTATREVADSSETALEGTGLQLVERELAGWTAQARREEQLETFALAQEIAERFVVSPERVEIYLRSHVDGFAGAQVSNVRQVVGGLSKETFLVTLTGVSGMTGVVLRRDIPNPPIATSAADEMEVLDYIHSQGLPVPEPLHAERDPQHFGMPFLISRMVSGAAISGAVSIDKLADEAADNCRLLAAFLGRLHALPVEGVKSLARPDYSTKDYVRDYILSWKSWWVANRMEPSAILETAFEWMLGNIPDSDKPVLVHGDAGLHNLMVDSGQTTAMIDWELVHIGDPSEDLQYCRNWVDQSMDFEEFMSIYRAHGGRQIDERTERFYAILVSIRNVCCSLAQYRGFRDARLPILPSAYSGIKWGRHFLIKAGEELVAALREG